MSAVFNQRTRQPDPTEICPSCKKKTVFYLGTDVLHGNPFSPASDTEVEHHYECSNPECRCSWSRVV